MIHFLNVTLQAQSKSETLEEKNQREGLDEGSLQLQITNGIHDLRYAQLPEKLRHFCHWERPAEKYQSYKHLFSSLFIRTQK